MSFQSYIVHDRENARNPKQWIGPRRKSEIIATYLHVPHPDLDFFRALPVLAVCRIDVVDTGGAGCLRGTLVSSCNIPTTKQ